VQIELPAFAVLGELAWVEMDKLAALPVLPDLPLLLRRLDGEAVTFIRMELDTEDATSLSRVEVLGSLPPFFSETLNNRKVPSSTIVTNSRKVLTSTDCHNFALNLGSSQSSSASRSRALGSEGRLLR